ncbi:hypothetical protein G4228_019072 [Cervus hanglu yarkandensis]|nr:hypothetical protein G4228_019072 [Cervus hanglu yarkandensis]
MNSRDDEVSVGGAGFGLQGGEQTRVHQAGSAAPQGPRLGPELGAPQSGEGGFPDPEGFESEWEVLDAGGLVLWGREGRPGTPVNDKGDALQLTDESVAAILWQLSDLDVLAVSRYPYPESYAVGEVFILWAPSCPWMHHGEPSSGDLNIRGLQDPGNSEPMALNRADVMPRGPDPPGECPGF